MNYKVEGALRRNKKYFILFGILWLFIAIVLIVPITLGFNIATNQKDLEEGIKIFTSTITNPAEGLAELVEREYISSYIKNLAIFTIIFAIIYFIKFKI